MKLAVPRPRRRLPARLALRLLIATAPLLDLASAAAAAFFTADGRRVRRVHGRVVRPARGRVQRVAGPPQRDRRLGMEPMCWRAVPAGPLLMRKLLGRPHHGTVRARLPPHRAAPRSCASLPLPRARAGRQPRGTAALLLVGSIFAVPTGFANRGLSPLVLFLLSLNFLPGRPRGAKVALRSLIL